MQTLNANEIYNMDCLTGMKEIPDDTADLVVTDPPYLINYKSNTPHNKNARSRKPIIGDDADEDLIRGYSKECYRILKPDTALYMFCSTKTVDVFKPTLTEAGFNFKNIIIWYKRSGTAGDLEAQYQQFYEPILYVNKGRAKMNGKRLPDIWEFPRVSWQVQRHQNQKPLNLIKLCMEKHSKEGDLVFDGFMGSGTTAIAAIQLNRKYLGFEIDPVFYFDAKARIAEELAPKV